MKQSKKQKKTSNNEIMRVVLKKSIDKLGRLGETINIADGYGRNYLIPQGLAVLVGTSEAKDLKKKKSQETPKVRKEKKTGERLSKKVKRQKRVQEKDKKAKKIASKI